MVKSDSIHRCIRRLFIHDYDQSCRLIKLRSLHAEVDWRIGEQRRQFLRQFYRLIDGWQGQFPNLREIFRPEQIDQLLVDSVDASSEIDPTPLYDFVLNCGYEDEAPRAGEELLHIDGNDDDRLVRRTTALHRAVRCWCPYNKQKKQLVRKLFKIYRRFEVHHWDERSGWTHFHVALWFGLYDTVAIIRLSHPVDPRLNGDPPLHWALRADNGARLAEWLLRRGADPNEANARGETPLHVVCASESTLNSAYDQAIRFLVICVRLDLSSGLRFDARDLEGNTPLHLACGAGYNGCCWSGSVLLTKGADPNAVNDRGSTPLHLICERDRADHLAALFFALCDVRNRDVRVDARDNAGRTPLQSAVASLVPNDVDLLLARGADLSEFRFPGEDYFAERLSRLRNEDDVVEKLRVASGILACVERLEYREYQLDLAEAMTVMKIYDRYGLFDRSTEDNERYDDDEEAKHAIIRGSLTLRDLMDLTPEDAATLFTYMEHYALRNSIYRRYQRVSKRSIELCLARFFENVSRSFFCRWALYPFQELMNYRMSIEVCQTILKYMRNEDLYRICLLTARGK